jgi:hypothetical protein
MKVKSIKKNVTIITLHPGEANQTLLLFSYETPVACHIQGVGYFRTSQFWSITTSRHINQWLRSEFGNPVHYKDGVTEKPQDFFDTLGSV